MVLGGAIFESGHISVVTIGEDPHAVEKLGKKLRRPKNARLGGPGVIGMSVQAVDEDDVDLRGFVGAVDLSEAVGFDFVWIHHLLVGRSKGGFVMGESNKKTGWRISGGLEERE